MSLREAHAETVYPSVAATGVGRLCGLLLNSLPIKVGRVRLTHVLFGPLLAPVMPVIYFGHKLLGRRYRLTSGAVEVWPVIGVRRRSRVDLDEIASITSHVRPGQDFYRAGDVDVRDADGRSLAQLEGVPNPDRVAALIEDLRESRRQHRDVMQTLAVRPTDEERAAAAG